MKQDYFIFLFGKLKNKYLALWATDLIYFVVCLKYNFLKKFKKKQVKDISVEEAYQLVKAVWTPKDKITLVENGPIDKSIDLSIVVPVYNYEKEVQRCIESLLDQKTSYKYEIIIVDDGSNQATKEILLKYKSYSSVRLIFQENGGISSARNTGINTAVGQYLMFVDCDDVVSTNCVQVLLDKAFEKSYDIVMAAHALVKVKNGIEIGRRNFIYSDLNVMHYVDDDFIMNYAGLPWGKVYKRELFNQIRFPVGYWYEDTIIHFLVFRLAKKYCYIQDVVYDYMWYEGNFSKVQATSNNRVLEHYWIIEKMLKENDRIGLSRDVILYKVMLNHLGGFLYNTIANLSDEIKHAVFVLSRNLVLKNRPNDKYKLNYSLKQLENAFLLNDFAMWELASKEL